MKNGCNFIFTRTGGRIGIRRKGEGVCVRGGFRLFRWLGVRARRGSLWIEIAAPSILKPSALVALRVSRQFGRMHGTRENAKRLEEGSNLLLRDRLSGLSELRPLTLRVAAENHRQPSR